jgi:hypothetical protein
MATIVVGSYMVRYPLGGMLSWVLQYLVGFDRSEQPLERELERVRSGTTQPGTHDLERHRAPGPAIAFSLDVVPIPTMMTQSFVLAPSLCPRPTRIRM